MIRNRMHAHLGDISQAFHRKAANNGRWIAHKCTLGRERGSCRAEGAGQEAPGQNGAIQLASMTTNTFYCLAAQAALSKAVTCLGRALCALCTELINSDRSRM